MLVLTPFAAADDDDEVATVKIAFTGYVYGGITEVTSSEFCAVKTLASPDAVCAGGCARRKTFLDTMRADGYLLVDIGTFAFGSLYTTLYRLAPGAECLAQTKYDLLAVGGADFYQGYDDYVNLLSDVRTRTAEASRFIVTPLTINPTCAKNSTAPALGSLVSRSWATTLENGLTVGFLSHISPYFESSVPDPYGCLTFPKTMSAAIDIMRQEIHYLRYTKNAKVIVLLYEMNRTVSASIDTIRELEHVNIVLTSRFNQTTPLVATSVFGDKFLIAGVTATYGTQIGVVQAQFNATNGSFLNIDAADVAKISTINAASAPREATLANYIDTHYNISADPNFSRKVAASIRTIDGRDGLLMSPDAWGCRTAACPMGRLLVTAFASYCKPVPADDPCIVFVNGGSIRGNFTRPDTLNATTPFDIKMFDSYRVSPFANTLAQATVTGTALLQALANSISLAPQQGGRFMQSNMRVIFNPYIRSDIPATNFATRVLSAEVPVPDPDGLGTWNGAPVTWTQINPAKNYTVMTLKYLLDGSDGYTSLVDNVPAEGSTEISTIDAFAGYLESLSAPLDYPTYEEMGSCLTVNTPLSPSSSCMNVYVNKTYNEYNRCVTNEPFCAANAGSILFSAMYVDPDQCAQCSGLGTCSKERVCTCSGRHIVTVDSPTGDGSVVDVTYAFDSGRPLTGPWRGIEMLRGADCSETRALQLLSDGDRAALYVAAALAFLVSIAWAGVLFYYRNEAVVRASSPYFGMLMCVGGLLVATSITLDATKNKTTDSCNGSVWLLVLGYSLIFACVFVKTHRIHAIFNAKILKGRMSYTDAYVLLYVGIITAVNVIVLILFRATAPLRANLFAVKGSFTIAQRCSSDEIAFTAVLLVYNGLLLAWGIYLAVRTRNVDSNFNESKYIGAAVYNCALVALVSLLFAYAVALTQPNVATVVRGWLLAYVVIFTLTVLFAPRLQLFFHGVRESQAARTQASDLERQVCSVLSLLTLQQHILPRYIDFSCYFVCIFLSLSSLT